MNKLRKERKRSQKAKTVVLSRKKSFKEKKTKRGLSELAGSLAATALRSAVPMLGKALITGCGDYRVGPMDKGNGSFMNLLPMFPGSDSTTMGFEEMVDFVYSSVEFKVERWSSNPGNATTFTRLRNISRNYQKYRHRGFYTGLISNVSTARTDSSTIGQWALFVQYSPSDPAPSTIAELQMLTGTQTAVGYSNLICPVECDRRGTALVNYLVEHGDDDSEDINFRMPFWFGVATWGFPEDGDNIGLLLATGRTEFIGRRVSDEETDARFYLAYNNVEGAYTAATLDPMWDDSELAEKQSPSDFVTKTVVTRSGVDAWRFFINYPGYYRVEWWTTYSSAVTIGGTPLPAVDHGSGIDFIDGSPTVYTFMSGSTPSRIKNGLSTSNFYAASVDDMVRIEDYYYVHDVSGGLNYIDTPYWPSTVPASDFGNNQQQVMIQQVPAALVLLSATERKQKMLREAVRVEFAKLLGRDPAYDFISQADLGKREGKDRLELESVLSQKNKNDTRDAVLHARTKTFR
jgi:hypothetical protein